MFTKGRIIFTIVFVVVFIIGMIYAYRKDMRQVKSWFGNVWQILLSVILIYLIYYIFVRFL
ncbi:MAG: hypothetical protein RIC15_04490 [Vicingaceae bacterium]